MAGASSRKLASTRSREEEDIGERLLHTEELPFLEGLRGNQALVDCILGVKTLSDVQVTSGYLSGVYNTLTREQTQPQADRAFSQSDQPYVVTGMI